MDRHTFFLDSATETLVQSRHQPFPMERMEWAERLDFDGSPLQSAIQLSSSIVPHVILRTEFWFLGYALIVGFLCFFFSASMLSLFRICECMYTHRD